MFKNIHNKLKTIANIYFWIGTSLSAISGLYICFIDTAEPSALGNAFEASALNLGYTFLGVIVILIGILSAWIGACFIYGFGELIETNSIIAKNTSKVKPKGAATSNAVHQLKEYEFTGNDTIIATCPCCYTKFSTKHISEDGLYICPSCKEKLKPTL